MATILETLENAEFNISKFPQIAKSQIKNATIALEKGYDIHADLDDLLSEYKDINNIPIKK